MMELFLLAGRQLRRKKLRVFLIVLGIAIGVAAVEQIKASHDLTTVEVSAGAEAGNVTLITESKIKAIKQEEHVLFVAPYVKDSYVTQNNTYLAVKGVTPEYRGIHSNLQLEQGNWFYESTHSNYTQIVLGYDVAKRLAVTEDLGVGDEFVAKIRLYGEEGPPRDKSTVVKIAGILESAGDEHDNQVFVGITEAMDMDEKDAYDGLLVKVDDPAFVASVREKIEEIGLNAQSAQDVIDEVNRLMVAVTLVLGFFSGISLVVGALMVVNTMIISVYERTREIGLSKALGASDLDIMKMFLAECLIIGVMGGILGDLLGIGFSVMIDLVGKPFLVSTLGGELGASLQAGSITAITPSILAVGFAISLVLSIVAGLYPARRAARLSPLDALRQI